MTTGLFVQAPLGLQGGTYPIYSAVVRACPAGAMCVAGSDQGWGPWSHQGGPGVTNFGLNCPVPIGVLPGEETYFISGNFPNGTPALTRLNLRPFFPYPGESQLLTVDAYVKASTGDDPITQVTYQYLVSDAPAQPVGDMQLKSGTAFNGTWAARFTPPDLVCNGRSNLQLPIVPTNRNGASPITLSFR